MEIYFALIVALFFWAAAVFYVIGLSNGNDGVGAIAVLVGAGAITQAVVGLVVPVKGGEPVGSMLEWVFTTYGLIGLGAVGLGILVGKGAGEEKRRGY